MCQFFNKRKLKNKVLTTYNKIYKIITYFIMSNADLSSSVQNFNVSSNTPENTEITIPNNQSDNKEPGIDQNQNIHIYKAKKYTTLMFFIITLIVSYILGMSPTAYDIGYFQLYIIVFSNLSIISDCAVIIIYNDDVYYRREVKIISPGVKYIHMSIKTAYLVLLILFFSETVIPAFILLVIYNGLLLIFLFVKYYQDRHLDTARQMYYLSL